MQKPHKVCHVGIRNKIEGRRSIGAKALVNMLQAMGGGENFDREGGKGDFGNRRALGQRAIKAEKAG